MKKRINKHIDKKHYVKVYIEDKNGYSITHFGGIIFEQNEEHVLMCDMYDFNYDGFVVVRKSDISEIKRTENEKFFDRILDKEGIKKLILKKMKILSLKLDTYARMFSALKAKGLPVIIECRYGKKDLFQIGPIAKVKGKKVLVNYFNASGEYDLKPVISEFKNITFFRVDTEYANIFFKYAKAVE